MKDGEKKGSIKLNNMEFYGTHGLTVEERKVRQLFIVSVCFDYDIGDAAINDDVNSTVNYAEVFELCRKILSKEFKLIETIAYNIAKTIKNSFPEVQNVEVSVRKPQVQLRGKIESAEVIYRL
jgi:dihydroneopterin aldolase